MQICSKFWTFLIEETPMHINITPLLQASLGATPLEKTDSMVITQSLHLASRREMNNRTFNNNFQPYSRFRFLNNILLMALSSCKCYFVSFSSYTLKNLLMSWRVMSWRTFCNSSPVGPFPLCIFSSYQ